VPVTHAYRHSPQLRRAGNLKRNPESLGLG
jgi:hypothetical protein